MSYYFPVPMVKYSPWHKIGILLVFVELMNENVVRKTNNSPNLPALPGCQHVVTYVYRHYTVAVEHCFELFCNSFIYVTSNILNFQICWHLIPIKCGTQQKVSKLPELRNKFLLLIRHSA